MIERAELVGGWYPVTSTPGNGASVECWLPIEITDDDEGSAAPDRSA